jgi:RNA polymerase sigma-70 factor (ECF subfamily)
MRLNDPFANPEPLIRRVYAYVAYRIGPGPEAEDVTSDAFERALRYRETFDPRKGDPVSWLIGIARRCIVDAAVSVRNWDVDLEEETGSDDLERDVLRRIEVAAAVAHLDERERELVALRYGADLTARQIGEVMGMKTNAVEVALHRALRSLREVVEAPETRATRAHVSCASESPA